VSATSGDRFTSHVAPAPASVHLPTRLPKFPAWNYPPRYAQLGRATWLEAPLDPVVRVRVSEV
jgi:hypothetical protein